MILRCARAQKTHRTGDVEEAAPSSQFDMSYAHMLPFCSARFHSAYIFAFDVLRRLFFLHTQLRLQSLNFLRVSNIFQDAAVTRPELQRIINECEAVGTESVQCTVSVCSFRESLVVFCAMCDTYLCNRANSEHVPGAGSDPFDPHGLHCALHQRADDSLMRNYVSCAPSARPRYVLATHFALSTHPPSMNRKHRK